MALRICGSPSRMGSRYSGMVLFTHQSSSQFIREVEISQFAVTVGPLRAVISLFPVQIGEINIAHGMSGT